MPSMFAVLIHDLAGLNIESSEVVYLIAVESFPDQAFPPFEN